MDLNSIMEIVKSKVGFIIQRPEMTNKMLQNPPVRFLQDTITSIIRATDFAKGLYTDIEMDESNLIEKQSKIKFFDKMINLLGICMVRRVYYQ